MAKRNKKTRRQYKDTLFRMLFRDKERLLELYNAISGKHYTNPQELEVVTLENAVYIGMKNDLAFLIDSRLNLYEHQSTVNPNMPLRLLEYTVEELKKLTAGRNLYGSSQIMLPTPHFVVFYNGITELPEESVQRLSDSYLIKEEEKQLELKVKILNINAGYNEELKKECRTLKEYAEFVNCVKGHMEHMSRDEAIDSAVEECIEQGILRDFLLESRAEVKNSFVYDFDEKAYRRTIKQEAYAEGRAAEKSTSVIELLEELGNVPKDMRKIILSQTDLELLKVWLKAAAKATDIESWKHAVNWSDFEKNES